MPIIKKDKTIRKVYGDIGGWEKRRRIKNEVKKKLDCGCPNKLELVVRTFTNGHQEYGYACKCGKTYIWKDNLDPIGNGG